MSLLSDMPHRSTIQRRTRARGTRGGSRDSVTVEQTGLACWRQPAGASEINSYAKRGISISHKIFYPTNPFASVASPERRQILITSTDRGATTISSPRAYDVKDIASPDASAGLGVLWRIMVDATTGEDD